MSYVQQVTNTNDTGAGSLRVALAAHTSGASAKMVFSASGTIALATGLQLNRPRVKVSGGSQKVIIASNYAAGSAYTTATKADGVVVEHLAFDNSASGGNGACFLVGDGVSSLAQPYRNFLAKHCYFRGNGDDTLGVIGRTCGLVIFEYCIFDGKTAPAKSALLAALPDYTSNPSMHVVFRHCLFQGAIRIPDISFGRVSVLGCVISQRYQGGRLYGGCKVNFVNNWMQTPSSGANDTTPICTWEDANPYNGETLQEGAIYSAGNMLDGRDESVVGRDMYHKINFGGQSPASLFRTTPWGKLPPVPDAATSRQLTLAFAGCYRNRSTNDAAAIAQAAFRRPASSDG